MTDWYQAKIAVRIVQLETKNAPRPLPLENGFNAETNYRVFDISDFGETSEAYFVLINESGEFWFIPTRHCRLAR